MDNENKTTYYYSNGQRIPLIIEPNVYAVKFKKGEKNDIAALSGQAQSFLREQSEHVGFISNYGLQIFQNNANQERMTIEGAQSVVRSVELLNDEPPVEFTTPAFREAPESPNLMFVTNRFVVSFKPEVSEAQVAEFNARHNVRIVERLAYVENGYLLEAPAASGGLSAIELANLYYESGLTLFSNPDLITERHRKSTATLEATYPKTSGSREILSVPKEAAERNIFLSQQWHLETATVTTAWTITRGNPNIVIAILDDGVEISHPEFNGKVVKQFDFAANMADGNPKEIGDRHGTACAGVATAKGVKAFGAAPNCQLMAVRTPQFLGVADEAKMFQWVTDNGADVISCSWGPTDGTGASFPLADNVRAAINYSATRGRGGKGCPIFWAAGNGNESVSLDGYAANPDVMAIAASTSRETRAWYSDFGPEICVCAPSNGDKNLGEKGIFTTDRSGTAGYNNGSAGLGDTAGDYTNNFGGTSSATPLVAGIAGLMLSVNANLTPPQVRDILQSTATKIGTGYDAGGHSIYFGYGRVNACEAVKAAQAESLSANPTAPTILGPARLLATDGPPSFQANPGLNRFYAVEITTQTSLFLSSNSAQRNDNNYYGSWAEGPLKTSPVYNLPAGVWNKLKNAEKIYYRMWTSTSSNSWVNHQVTTSDALVSNAPTIEISSTPSPSGPSLTGPVSVSRNSAPPVLRADPRPNTFYAVEIAAQSVLFLPDNSSQRNNQNYYASWSDTPFMSASSYSFPTAVWERLKNNNRLYFRMWTSSSNTTWVNHTVTTLNNNVENAPSFEITGSEPRLSERFENMNFGKSVRDNVPLFPAQPPIGDSRAFTGPAITGPMTYDPKAKPPSFNIETGQNPYYAVECATDWQLFDLDNENQRQPHNFFGSWQQAWIEARGTTLFTIPEDVWDQLDLHEGGRLFYRVITTSSNNGNLDDLQTSTRDEEAAQAPSIRLEDKTHLGHLSTNRMVYPPISALELDEDNWQRS